MRSTVPSVIAAALAMALLAACSAAPDAGSRSAPESTAPVGSALVISAPPPPSSAGLPGDHAQTARYRIAIALPTLPADERVLAEALRATADDAKRQFLDALPDAAQPPERARHPLLLQLDFKVVARTPAFTSVRESGMQDLGGAHPIPIEAAFVFDLRGHRLLALDDLFADPEPARRTLAGFARAALLAKFTAAAPRPGEGSPAALREWKANMRQMLDHGTEPITVNYSVFAVRAGATAAAPSPGLTLVFPPYQVAPYVDGVQTVNVPTNVFAAYLKPGYRVDFAAPGGPG